MPKRDNAIRLGLVGPVLPLRGGIAQHTTRLHRALGEQAILTTLSFSRQYPRWLFPGESDRDADHKHHVEPGVEYSIDSLNPSTWSDAVGRFVENQVVGVVVPWWTVFFAPCFYFMTRRLAARRIPVVFMCHNVVDHETAPYKRWVSRAVLARADGFCVHGASEAVKLAKIVPGARVAVLPHPLYDQYPAATGAFPRRAGLELLFFGFVRPYKGLDVLLDAMAALERRDVRLSIVGEFWRGLEETRRRIEQLGLGDRVDVIPRYVTEQEAAEYFDRADAVVLPYLSATGSGIVAMAYHYGKPVIATRVGGLPDVVQHERTGYLVDPGSPAKLAGAIERATREDLTRMRPDIETVKATMTWGSLAAALISLFEVREPIEPNASGYELVRSPANDA